MNELTFSDKFVLDAVSAFYFLTKIGYTKIEVFDHKLEFGVSFISDEKNREITLAWNRGPEIFVSLRRQHRKILPLFVRDIDEQVFVNLNRFYESEFREINQNLAERTYPEILQMIADFLRKHLMQVVDGVLWVTDLAHE